MSYNKSQFHAYLDTAGKITVMTALLGVVAFSLVFLLNLGTKEFKQATAQGLATTSVTVLNTPPQFVAGPFESPESSTSSPTNSGDDVTWIATAEDSNDEDYFLLICDSNATPTANSSAPPTCGDGASSLWAVSGTTTSGVQASVATTTTEGFAESNDWYAWVCDSVSVNPRCNDIAQQGTGSTSSPFNVNHRPTFTGFWDDSPADPGATVIFYATSTDSDTTGAADTVSLWVCNTNSFTANPPSCDDTTLASSSFPITTNATATYALPAVIQDDDYEAYGFIVDNHDHPAVGGAQGTDSVLTVNNVAPEVLSGTIDLNGGVDIVLTEGVESTGFSLDFTVTDNNSCVAVGGGDEVVDYTASVYRSGVGSTTCDGTAGPYDPNNCYTSGVPTTTWNLTCTASSTTCGGTSDATVEWNCTFPLWYIAEPTNGADASSTPHFDEDWRAAVSATDDDAATGNFTEGTGTNPEVIAVTALNLLTATIPYGAIEPGDDTGTLNASTTVETTGNTGLNESLSGESMCPGYNSGEPCANSSTSTIPESEQEFADSALAYGSGVSLSSTTPQTLFLNIPKTTSTSTPNSDETFWGIAIPASITLAGSYTGENTFTAVMSDPSFW